MEKEPENYVSSISDSVSAVDYHIADVTIRAFFDNNHTLLFVIDSTINDKKPNVWLIMNPSGGRKWDDILTQDWHIDLETVRPRKNNKYQKLDVEYTGLDKYENLITQFTGGKNISDALSDLNHMRDVLSYTIASRRLDNAHSVAAQAQETISKSTVTLANLHHHLQDLQHNISEIKSAPGKHPSPQQIRTELQIDSIQDKINRIGKRVENAEKRLEIAQTDASSAQRILNLLAVPTQHTPGAINDTPDTVETDTIPPLSTTIKHKATNMAEETKPEEVKPLFDKDPEILDEEIAFKPISYETFTPETSADTLRPVPPDTDSHNQDDDNNISWNEPPAPLSLTSATPDKDNTQDANFAPISDIPSLQSVLDSMRAIDSTEEHLPKESAPLTPDTNTTTPGTIPQAPHNTPVVDEWEKPKETYPEIPETMSAESYRATTEGSAQPGYNNNAPLTRPAPLHDISPATNASGDRPLSPLGNNTVRELQYDDNGTKSKFLYYILLVILIALSIFALWLYQKNAIDNIPELTQTSPMTQATPAIKTAPVITKNDSTESMAATVTSTPDLKEKPADLTETPVLTTTQPVLLPTESELQVEIFANPVPTTADTVSETQTSTSGANTDDAVIVMPLPAPTTVEPLVTEQITEVTTPSQPVVVNKPEYNVSQPEKMFVASKNYETEPQPASDDDIIASYTEVEISEPTIVSVPEIIPSPTQKIPDIIISEPEENPEPLLLCSDGTLPDNNGCCTDEVFTDMENGTFACCQPYEDGECFAPMEI